MRGGQLRHWVTIQRRLEEQNAAGEVTWTFVDWQSMWASVEPLSGRELLQASQIGSNLNARIRIRFFPGINAKMRVRHSYTFGDEPVLDYYDIESVIHINERFREMHLMCVRRDNEGYRSEISSIILPTITSSTTFNTLEDLTTVGTVTSIGTAPIAYSITGSTDDALFVINSSSGVLTFIYAPNYEAPGDAGADNVYNLTVTATNVGGATNQNIAVTVQNIDTFLFGSGELGEYWDTGILGSMWQDTAGTTPAVVDSAVARIDGQTNGKNYTQATSASRPILRQGGGINYLEFDATDDYMSVASSAAYFKFAHDGTGMTVWAVVQSPGSSSIFLIHSGTAAPGVAFKHNSADPNGRAQFQVVKEVFATVIDISTAAGNFPSATTEFVVATYKTQSGNDATIKTADNTTVSGAELDTPSSADAGADFFLGYPGLSISRFYGGGIINRVLTAAELAKLYAWAKARYGAL